MNYVLLALLVAAAFHPAGQDGFFTALSLFLSDSGCDLFGGLTHRLFHHPCVDPRLFRRAGPADALKTCVKSVETPRTNANL